MTIRKHIIKLEDTSPSEMARFRQIMLAIWRQQIEDDKNNDEMERFIRDNHIATNSHDSKKIIDLIKSEDLLTEKFIYKDLSISNDFSKLTDSDDTYSGDFYSMNGTYLGKIGKPNNNLYVVENDGYKIHDTGNKTAEIFMDKSKIIDLTKKTALTHSQMLDRANWIYAEGGYKIPEFFAYTIENAYNDKNIAKKKEDKLYFHLMQDSSGRLDKDKYLSGGYKNKTGTPFWNARGTTSMNNDMKNTIAAVIKSKLYPEKDPTGGTNSWLGYKKGLHQGEYYIQSLGSRHFFQKRIPGKPLKNTSIEKKYKTID